MDRLLAGAAGEAAADVPPAAVAGGVGLPMPDPTSVPWAPGHEPDLGV